MDKISLPRVVPIFPLSGAILLPRGQLPLNIFEPRYLNMVDDALRTNRLIAMVQPKIPGGEAQGTPEVFSIGGLGRLTALSETDDGRYLITLTGLSRFEILREVTSTTPYRQAEVSYDAFAGDRQPATENIAFDRPRLLAALKRYFEAFQIQSDWDAITAAPGDSLVNSLSMISPVPAPEKQALLEAPTLADRAEVLVTLIELALAEGPHDGPQKPN